MSADLLTKNDPLKMANGRYKLLSEMASQLLLSESPREIINIMFRKLSAYLGLEVYIHLSLEGDRLKLIDYEGIPADRAGEIEHIAMGQHVCGRVAHDKQGIIAENLQDSTDAKSEFLRSLGITAFVCHPLIAHGKLFGTLGFGTRMRTKFNSDDIELMRVVCDQVATAIERAELIRELKEANVTLKNDIAKREWAERSLVESERFMTNVFNSIQDGICILDRDLNIVRVNHIKEKWYPYAMPLAGKKCYEVFQDRTEPCEGCPSLKAMKEKQRSIMNIQFRDREGPKGWLELNAFPLFDNDGNVTGAIEYVRDITARREMESALMESKEKFRVLAETTSVAIMLVQNNKFVYVNPAALEVLGYEEAELLDKDFWELVHPDDQEQIKRFGIGMLYGEQIPVRHVFKFLKKNGEAGLCDLTIGPITYRGQIAGVVTARDITEQKNAEDGLIEAKTQAELYLDLMSHDISNMNQIAMGFLELINDSPRLGEQERDLITKPIEALKSSANLIENVRKLQKFRLGGYETEIIDIGAVISRLVQQYTHIRDKEVMIEYEPVSGCFVKANALINDVFSNLIGNAIKHGTSGDIPRIKIELSRPGVGNDGFIMATVEDFGTGIPDVLKDKIFNRYTRGDTKSHGKGLGLYLVKTLVERFNGQVWVEDRVQGDYSQGSRFVVVMPAAK